MGRLQSAESVSLPLSPLPHTFRTVPHGASGADSRVIDYAISKASPTSRPVLSMHLTAENCQCPSCVSIRTGEYSSKARNVYTVPVGQDRQSVTRAASELDRLAGDVGDWAQKGPHNTQPVLALQGSAAELRAQQQRFAGLASQLNAASRDAPVPGDVRTVEINRRAVAYDA